MNTQDQLSITDCPRCPEGLLALEVEDFKFYRAFEESDIQDFKFGYLQIFKGNRLVCALPYFLTEYRMDTMVSEGILKRLVSPIRFTLACVGHPSADIGKIDGEVSDDILCAINAHLFSKAGLIAYKWFAQALPLQGFSVVDGLPITALNIKDYFSRLKSDRRKNFRKKRERSAALRFETLHFPQTLPDQLASEIFSIYQQTAARADFKFENLTEKYFQQTAPLSRLTLAFEGPKLIGFIQCIAKDARMVGKYIGMDYQKNEKYGLYFSLILNMIEQGDRAGYSEIELGPTSYYFKKLLGCHMTATQIYYRHSNKFINWALRHCKFLLAPTPEELR